MKKTLERRINAALGKIPCDGVIKGAYVFDVFSGRWIHSDIGWIDGFIAGVDLSIQGKREFSGKGKWVVPGFIDAHVHLESSLMTPTSFEQAVLPKGTTTAICDPHELANVLGVKGIEYFLNEAVLLNMNLRVMLSSCVPATHLETNGGGVIGVKDLLPMKTHPKALGLAEMMNFPGVLSKDPEIIEKLLNFIDTPIDGHCPQLTGKNLSAYASTGISSCHESSELDEAHEKMTKGVSVWIREGSVAKDLNNLISLLNPMSSSVMGFCTDDRNPLDIIEEGHVDFLVRKAISKKISPEAVLRASSWSVANHYSLNRGPNRVGALAPGYRADLILLDDLNSLSLGPVFKSGVLVSEIGYSKSAFVRAPNTIMATLPEVSDLKAPKGQVRVIGVQPGKILTDSLVMNSSDKGVSRLTVLERHGRRTKPSNGYVYGFGEDFKGAFASSVGHDSHNLIVVAQDLDSMRTALRALIDSGGGFVVAHSDKVLSHLPLPFAGLMSLQSNDLIHSQLKDLKLAAQSLGCVLHEPFLQLAFLSLPVIPALKLTDQGLVDVNRFKFISVAV